MNSSTKRNEKKNSKYGFKRKWWQLTGERGVRWTGALIEATNSSYRLAA